MGNPEKERKRKTEKARKQKRRRGYILYIIARCERNAAINEKYRITSGLLWISVNLIYVRAYADCFAKSII